MRGNMFFFVSVCCAMDQAIAPLTGEQDYKCYWVARYVHKCFSKLNYDEINKLHQFSIQCSELSQKVKEYRDNMHNSDKQVERFLNSFLDQTIDKAYDRYYNLLLGAQYQIAFCLKKTPVGQLLNDGVCIISKETMNNMLVDSCFGKGIEVEGRIKGRENVPFDPELFMLKGRRSQKTMDSSESKNSIVAFNQLLHASPIGALLDIMNQKRFELKFKKPHYYADDQKVTITPSVHFIAQIRADIFPLLQKICEGSKPLENDIAPDYRLSAVEIEKLRNFHANVSHLPEWQTLQEALIGVQFAKPTFLQRAKDRMLLAIPLILAEAVIPELTYRFTSGNMIPLYIMGKTTGTLGLLLCGLINSCAVGNRLFPFLDKYNSDVDQLQNIFGEIGVRKVVQPTFFFWNSMFHYCAAAMGIYCLSVGGLLPVIGMTMYGMRLLLLLHGILSTKQHNRDSGFFGRIAVAHPGLRRNKYDRRFTLKDLVDPHIYKTSRDR